MSKVEKEYLWDIHLEDHTSPYEGKQATNKDMIFMGGREVISLNGDWKYAVDQYESCIRQKWFKEGYYDDKGFSLPVDFSFEQWPTMKLPVCWNVVSPEYRLYEGTFVYFKEFVLNRTDNDLFLRIGGANYVTRVFLNGEYIGMHRGGSTPFFFNITDIVRFKGDEKSSNRLLIAVDDTRKPTQVPMDNTDWFNYGGIYRDIEIVEVPRIHIKDFRIGLVRDGSFDKISVNARLSYPAEGKFVLKIADLGLEKELDINEGSAEAVIIRDEMKNDIELWSTENPRLYDCELTYIDTAGRELDTVRDRVGFREIRVEGTDIILNGKSVFLRGISCHEESVVNGKALTEDERIENIRLAKELGCNFMRIAHYPHHENMAKLADEMGIMLWEEIPVYWAIRFEREETYQDAENQLLELIGRDYNRASVIVWSIGNENADTDERLKFMSRLAATAHREDKTRLVSAACLVDAQELRISDRLADHLDLIGINEYCGWYTPDFNLLPGIMKNSSPDKPVIITEFGADALTGYHGKVDEKGCEECQADVYEKQTSLLETVSFVKGMTPWILYDFRCPRRTSYIQKYYNRKGLLNEDKTYKKPAFYVLQNFYKKLMNK
ncbi:glycoside hydrolase family 2 protein [Butyrivibrio sp. MC2013]|uniref:glycoside hydrolase family 2 protein n=1 Tax=Butyrivibrio sp. MC2013 TaxID=1280686 RepID=UPI00041C4391|nr:glycoside hydrolase family 2 [Butyrivibrio sp. MC2013]